MTKIDWEVVTNYIESVGTTDTVFPFKKPQDLVKVTNGGGNNLIYTIGSKTGTLTSGQSITIQETISNITLRASVGKQSFQVWATEAGTEKDEESVAPDLSGIQSQVDSLTTSLAQKALQSDLDTANTNIAKKADKTYVDTVTQSLANGSPKGAYATLSALQTAFPTGNNNIYLVTADGKWYYWSGSAWTAGGNYQSTDIADGSVTYNKTKFVQPGINLFDKSTLTSGYVINTSGNLQANANLSVSDFIPVKPNTVYTYNGGVKDFCFFDSAKNFISITYNQTVTTPANCAYVRFDMYNTEIDTCMFVQGSSVPSVYSPFKLLLPKVKITDSNIDDNSIQLGKLDSSIGIKLNGITKKANLLNKDTILLNSQIAFNTGQVVSNTVFACSDFIPIKPNVAYTFSDNAPSNFGVLYDSNKNYIANVSGVSDVINAPVTPLTKTFTQSNIAFIRLNFITDRVNNISGYLNNYMMVEGNSIPSVYESFGININDLRIVDENIPAEFIKNDMLSTEITDTLQTVDVMNTGYESERAFYVYDFIDGVKTDSEVIKECLQFASIFDNRTITFDRKDWHIDEAILIPANTTIIVDGVMIKQNNEVFDNVFRSDNFQIDSANPYGFPLSIQPLNNIKIIGKNGAKIEGPEINKKLVHPTYGEQDATGDYWGWRTLQILLARVSGFEIAGLNYTKQRCYANLFDRCSYGYIHDLNITSTVKNGDGVNIRLGCHDIRVENIYGSTSDDLVAINSLSFGTTYPYGTNYIYPITPGDYLIGQGETIEDRYIYNISVKNITLNTPYLSQGVAFLSRNHHKIYNIQLENIIDGNAIGTSDHLAMVGTYANAYNSLGYNAGDLNKVRVNNVISNTAENAIAINDIVADFWINKVKQNRSDGAVISAVNMTGVTLTNS
jgi:hypothetical protein